MSHFFSSNFYLLHLETWCNTYKTNLMSKQSVVFLQNKNDT